MFELLPLPAPLNQPTPTASPCSARRSPRSVVRGWRSSESRERLWRGRPSNSARATQVVPNPRPLAAVPRCCRGPLVSGSPVDRDEVRGRSCGGDSDMAALHGMETFFQTQLQASKTKGQQEKQEKLCWKLLLRILIVQSFCLVNCCSCSFAF